MTTTFGYCRVSTPSQKLERQVQNITKAYPDAIILQDKYTGTRMDRPSWEKLMKVVKPGDRIIFDQVSRMSRNATEGVDAYFHLMDQGIDLVFLKEPAINTETYRTALNNAVPMTGTSIDSILKGVNEFLRTLATDQIKLAFAQSEKEVMDTRRRTSEGLKVAKMEGKQVGRSQGDKLNVKKKDPAKDVIRTHCKTFGGTLSDAECQTLAGISRNTFYRYKAEIRQEQNR